LNPISSTLIRPLAYLSVGNFSPRSRPATELVHVDPHGAVVVRVEARRVRHSIAITLVALLGGAAAIVSVVSVAFYVPVIVLFGRDDPAQTLAGYLSAIAVPIIALALVIVSLVWSLQLLRRKRDAAAVLVAAFVCVAMVCAGVQLRPH
jgi:hypothetical protein